MENYTLIPTEKMNALIEQVKFLQEQVAALVITDTQLSEIVAKATETGYLRALKKTGEISPILYKCEAYKLYKRRTVDRWIREGLINEYSDGPGSRVRLNRDEVEKVAMSCNTATYMNKG